MLFRTEITPDKLPTLIQLTDRIVTVGSCFAAVMGERLAANKLTVLNNPLGTLFNPVSIAKLLTASLSGETLNEAGYVLRDDLWFHYDAPSSFWANSRAELASTLAAQLQAVGEGLRQANWLLLTLGTSVVYQHREAGQIVANCHKMPGTLFNKSLADLHPIRAELDGLIAVLCEHNPDLQIVLTVSPVRHIRDGLVLNSASKALLRVVCDELTAVYPNVHYFPAYELVQDDLRDYRFYEADLIHPNAQAHDYVFGKFADSAFSPDLRAFMAQWEPVQRALAHRPLHGLTTAHQQFLQKILRQLDALPLTIDTTAERAEVLRRLL